MQDRSSKDQTEPRKRGMDGNRSKNRGQGPADLNQIAFKVMQQATGETPPEPPSEKNPAAVTLGRLGGLKGGAARAKKLTSEQRKEIARKAAQKRWQSLDQEQG